MSDPLLGALKITKPAHIVTVNLFYHSASIEIADKMPRPAPPQPIVTYYLNNGCPLFVVDNQAKDNSISWRINTIGTSKHGLPLSALTVYLMDTNRKPFISIAYHRNGMPGDKQVLFLLTAPANTHHINTLNDISRLLQTHRH